MDRLVPVTYLEDDFVPKPKHQFVHAPDGMLISQMMIRHNSMTNPLLFPLNDVPALQFLQALIASCASGIFIVCVTVHKSISLMPLDLF